MADILAGKQTGIAALMAPSSIAVIGASDNPHRIGGRVIHNLTRYGFEGQIYPINPNRETIQGRRAWPTVTHVGEPIDVAVLAIPIALALSTLEDCARAGVRACIVFTSGFAEMGENGKQLQQQMTALAQKTGMRIVGPNCQGVATFGCGAVNTFATPFLSAGAKMAPTAIISQSGAVASMIYNISTEHGGGCSYWVSTGNEADLDIADFMQICATDPEVSVIQLYLEGVRDGPKLLGAFASAYDNGKHVIALKSGRSIGGQAAAASHTGALATDDAVVDAVFRRYGVQRVESISELATFAQYSLAGKRVANRRVAIISNSGGLGVMAADQCTGNGLPLAALDSTTIARLREILPEEYASFRNPVDLTGQTLNDPSLFPRTLRTIAEDPGVDVIVVALGVLGKGYDIPGILEALSDVNQEARQLVSVACIGGTVNVTSAVAELGVPAFEQLDQCFRGLRGFFDRAETVPPPLADKAAKRCLPLHLVENEADQDGILDEVASKRLLANFGIEFPEELLVKNVREATEAASALGYPVALKVVSTALPHKSDVGGVHLGLGDEDAVRGAYESIQSAALERIAQRSLTGILVQPMAPPGVEIAVGAKYDPVFGPVVLVGAGGTLVEFHQDTKLIIPPFTADDVRAAIEQLRVARRLRGFRGELPADIDSLCELVFKFGEFVLAGEGQLDEVDLNPVVVTRCGRGTVIVDALVRLKLADRADTKDCRQVRLQ